jgi:hypothetical protein
MPGETLRPVFSPGYVAAETFANILGENAIA